MKITSSEVDDPLPCLVLDIRIRYVPFHRNGPIKYLRSTRHFMDCERNTGLDLSKSLSHAFARNTATYWKEFSHELVHGIADILTTDVSERIVDIH